MSHRENRAGLGSGHDSRLQIQDLPTEREKGFPEGKPESWTAVTMRGTLAPRVEMSLAR